MEWFAVCATIEIMYQLHEDVEGGVYVELRRLVFCVCLMITIKVIVITGGMTLTPHSSIWLWKACADFTCLPVWSFFSTVLQLALASFDVIQPHTKCFLSWRVFCLEEECNFTLIKIPSSPSFIPSENDISQNVISSELHGSYLAQGGIILLVKWSFRQCGPVRIVLHLAREALKGYTSVSCCQLLWLFLLSAAQTGKNAVKMWGESYPTVFSREWGDYEAVEICHITFKDKSFSSQHLR